MIFLSGIMVYPYTCAQRTDSTIYNSVSDLMTRFAIPDELIHTSFPDGAIPGMGFILDGQFFTVWYDGVRALPHTANYQKVIDAHENHLRKSGHIPPKYNYVLFKEKSGKTRLRAEETATFFSYMEDVLVPYDRHNRELFSTILQKEMERDALITEQKTDLSIIFTAFNLKIDNIVQSNATFLKYKNLYESYYRRVILENVTIELTLTIP